MSSDASPSSFVVRWRVFLSAADQATAWFMGTGKPKPHSRTFKTKERAKVFAVALHARYGSAVVVQVIEKKLHPKPEQLTFIDGHWPLQSRPLG